MSAKMFEYATSVLLSSGARPELRAAVYELLATIDGVALTGEVRDPLGRMGTGVSIEVDYSGVLERYTLIFDSETSHPLAYTERLLEPRAWIDSQLEGYTVLEETGQVADTESRP